LTGPSPVLSVNLLDCAIVYEPLQYSRGYFLMETDGPLDRGKSNGVAIVADRLANSHFAVCQLQAIHGRARSWNATDD
jgi:hypothetical protein